LVVILSDFHKLHPCFFAIDTSDTVGMTTSENIWIEKLGSERTLKKGETILSRSSGVVAHKDCVLDWTLELIYTHSLQFLQHNSVWRYRWFSQSTVHCNTHWFISVCCPSAAHWYMLPTPDDPLPGFTNWMNFLKIPRDVLSILWLSCHFAPLSFIPPLHFWRVHFLVLRVLLVNIPLGALSLPGSVRICAFRSAALGSTANFCRNPLFLWDRILGAWRRRTCKCGSMCGSSNDRPQALWYRLPTADVPFSGFTNCPRPTDTATLDSQCTLHLQELSLLSRSALSGALPITDSCCSSSSSSSSYIAKGGQSNSSSWCQVEQVTRCYISLSDNYFFFFRVARPLSRDGSAICNPMTQVQFEVKLRPTVIRLVCLGAGLPMGPWPDFNLFV
jgi:hypothetical protein